jgi:RimJ/RimL family protein N-acetyltransferase
MQVSEPLAGRFGRLSVEAVTCISVDFSARTTGAPEAWGCGYAAEACAAALDWFADVLPSEPVVLCTQTGNDRSMRLAAKLGFTEVERFEEYGAEQWFGV